MQQVAHNNTRNSGLPITEMFILTLLFVFSIMGSSYFGISLFGFMLSPYRFMFLVVALYTLLKYKQLKIPSGALPFLKFYLLWVIWGCCSILWAKDMRKTVSSDIILVIALCSIVICSQFLLGNKTIQIILNAISVCFIFVTILGLYESITGVYYFANKTEILTRMAIEKYRAPLVFFTNQNDYSLFLVYGIFIALQVREITGSKILKLIYDISIGVAVWLLIFAGSRGCVLSLAIGVAYWLLCVMREKRRRGYIWALFIVAIIIMIAAAIYSGQIIESLNGFFHFGVTSESIRSDTIRRQLVIDGVDMLLSSFGLGVGTANAGYYLENVYCNTGGILALHNWGIQIFAEAGLLVGTLYIGQYVLLFKRLRKIFNCANNAIEKKQARLFLCVTLAFVVGMISPSSVLDMEWLWMAWALIIAFIGQSHSKQFYSQSQGVYKECQT